MYCERAIMAFWEWGNYRDRKETRGCQGKGYRINGRITEDFKSSETTLYDTVAKLYHTEGGYTRQNPRNVHHRVTPM